MSLLDDKISDWENRQSQMIYIYHSELPSKKRIKKIVEDYIYPKLKADGFKFFKTKICLIRETNKSKCEITFDVNKNNFKDSISFRLAIKITSKDYADWAENKYDTKYLKSGFILDSLHHQIKNWKRDNTEDWYMLSIDDNEKIVQEIISNIKKNFIENVSFYEDLNKVIIRKVKKLDKLKYLDIFECNLVLDLSEIINDYENVSKFIYKIYTHWIENEEYADKKNTKLYLELKNRISKK